MVKSNHFSYCGTIPQISQRTEYFAYCDNASHLMQMYDVYIHLMQMYDVAVTINIEKNFWGVFLLLFFVNVSFPLAAIRINQKPKLVCFTSSLKNTS